MSAHPPHPEAEFCDVCRPIMMADYAAGERLWKHWCSQWLGAAGQPYRFKVLSKRTKDSKYEYAFVMERAPGMLKAVVQRAAVSIPEELDAFVRGLEAAFRCSIERRFEFEVTDLSKHDSYGNLVHRVTEENLGDWQFKKTPPKQE